MTETTVDPWTIQRLLVWTAGHFEKQGRDAPRLAAEILLSEALGCRRIDLYARFGEVPAEPALSRFRDWVRRHAVGEPVAYLVGYRDFYSLRFLVNRSVLIPRPETEQLVVEAISWCQKRLSIVPQDPLQILDLGTGSGCIAVTLARQLPTAVVTAADISPAALDVARQNAGTHAVSGRIQFVQSDLDAAIPSADRFDLVISNPPYIGRNEKGTLDPMVREHEPAEALFGGDEGSELTARIIELTGRRLKPGGRLLLETSPFIAVACAGLVQQQGGFSEPRILKDLDRHDRVILADRL